MFRFNAKAWVGGLVAPLTLILTTFVTEGVGLDLPWVQPAIEYGVVALLTGLATWLVPNAADLHSTSTR